MKLLFITTDIKTTNGWGTYGYNIITESANNNEIHVALQTLTDLSSELENIKQYEILYPPAAVMWHPLKIWRQAMALKRLVKKVKPDIIHIMVEPYTNSLAFWSPRTPVVLTIHGTYALYPRLLASKFKGFWSSLFYRMGLKKVDTIISVSQHTLNRFLDCAPQTGRATSRVIPNSIVMPADGLPTKALPNSKEIHVITVGAVKRRKGIHLTIPILAKWANERGQKVIYDVVGYLGENTDYVHRVRKLAKRYSSSNFSVIFHGQVYVDKKIGLLRKARLYIHLEELADNPNEVEGFGIGIIEAASYGVPALVVKGSATTEAIKEGVSGFSVDLQDEEGIYAKLNQLLLNGVAFSQEIRAWAKEHSPKSSYDQIKQVYSSLIKAK